MRYLKAGNLGEFAELVGYGTCEVAVVEPEVDEVREASELWWYERFEAVETEVKIHQRLQQRDASRDGSVEAISAEVELGELRKRGEV